MTYRDEWMYYVPEWGNNKIFNLAKTLPNEYFPWCTIGISNIGRSNTEKFKKYCLSKQQYSFSFILGYKILGNGNVDLKSHLETRIGTVCKQAQ